MCEKCRATKEKSKVKLSLWMLESNKRCAVIGTCLQIKQLRRVKTRFNQHTKDLYLETDYDLHSYCVGVSSHKNPISVYLNKLLNKQYQSFINQCRSLKTDSAIESCWKQIDPDDLRSLAGYFWCFITSKYCSEELKNRIYGDIHMISHIAGQSEKRSIQQVKQENNQLLTDLAKKHKLITSKQFQIKKQQQQIDQLTASNIKLNQMFKELTLQQQTPLLSVAEYEKQILDQSKLISHLEQKIQRLSERNNPTDNLLLPPIEVKQPVSSNKKSCSGDCANCRKTDLCGKKILYVGGLSRHRKKFEKMTRAINGEFFYHDGGKQQSEHQLDDLVKKADCVFCPVDCISHSAMWRIKSLAKNECKDCIFLKSASLSSFKNEVMRYAS